MVIKCKVERGVVYGGGSGNKVVVNENDCQKSENLVSVE